MHFIKWILLLILGITFFGTIGYAGWWTDGMFPDNKPLLSAIFAGAGVLMLFLYLILSSLFEGRQVDELHPAGIFSGIFKGFGAAILLFVLSVCILFACGMVSFSGISIDWSYIGFRFAATFMIAVCEEIVFRGFLFRFLDQRWNTALALFISAIVFGAYSFFRTDATIWTSAALAIDAGLLLGVAFKYSGNLFFPIGLNWMFGFLLSLPSSFGLNFPGHEILTGGDFGIDASIITVSLSISFILVYLLRMKRSRYKEDKRIIKPLWSR